ncbi:MAG: hypothetical protein EG828_15105 [Deltaproteobacteria bacterium]|nr:hypothetical protein [Deltaproteobacteria bacterium]
MLCPAVAGAAEAPLQTIPLAADSAPDQQERLPASFELGFPDVPRNDAQDGEFTGFSFSDEPPPPAQDSTPAFDAAEEDDFSFADPAEDESNATSWDLQFDETGSGMDDYENFLPPESIDSSKDQREDAMLKETEDIGSLGTSYFDFSTGPEQEDIFGMENEPVLPAPAEKKAQPSLADFDKEFELIFADDTPDESGEKTP